MYVEIGDIFWFDVTYPSTGETETRPVVIIDIIDDTPVFATFATITGSNIKDFNDRFDKWKVPLFQWEHAGLEKGSYVKANCIAQVEASAFKKEDYIGKIHPYDLKNVNKKVEEFINSEEDPW
ncbi:PemK-like, MazF-like toxin of type II toxin-antitoxin system [Anoxybacillus vitaminiphilus]|jgi:mRNA-degrading endonuclease toxin of MazEF toxin-antitoxin module|uniref:PemK-like, MazF-like toxin of type II toxin-antitoxin system n=1 Tax=Paranoxybacillus vitaminiphilus TaxID=581036 RepID=A0A327Y6F5_9BACL|nr:type II toxin-antitoxin system PemK/MazF family toxin [Anoxybacillus vitaminiphilus]RAK15315.1 PemK-like, MazF-like toxin of type II toxin-antitoxin system [Anoxybacillus vitaminiphilus]